jgi:hypothetical protein
MQNTINVIKEVKVGWLGGTIDFDHKHPMLASWEYSM